MDIVLIIIMLMVGVSFLLKLTYLPVYGQVAISFLCALMVGLGCETAAGQSKTQISGWLQSPELMLDMAVLLTVDVFLQVSFCILQAKAIYGDRLSKYGNIFRIITLWIPGILVFPTLFAMLVEMIFAFPGMDFATIGWTLASIVFASAAIMPFLLKRLIPEKDLRLELIFMSNVMIAMLGVVATVNGRTAVSGSNNVEWLPLTGIFLIIFTGAAAGYLLYKRKNNKQFS